MPLNADQYIAKRRGEGDRFKNHLVPQMDYLEKLLNECIRSLNARVPKDDERIREFDNMAKAIHTAGHSGDSFMNRKSTLENALITLNEGLGNFMSKEGNLELLQQTADNNPAFKNDLHPDDKNKNLLQHFRNVDAFGEIGARDTLRNLRQEQFLTKMRADVPGQPRYVNYTGRQLNFLGDLMAAASADIKDANDGFSTEQSRALENMSNSLKALARRANMHMAEGEINSALDSIENLPAFLAANNGEVVKLLRQTINSHPDISKNSVDNDENLKKKNIVEHINELGAFFELNFTPSVTDVLTQNKTELDEEARQRAIQEAIRQEQIEQIEHAEFVKKLRDEEEKEKKEDEDEKTNQANEIAQARQQEQNRIQERRQFRQQNAAFVLPEGYDNRDVAGMIVDSAKQEGEQYMALVRFRNELRTSIEAWNNYAGTQYATRKPAVMNNFPENPSGEQMAKAIEDTLKAVPAAEREQSLREYYGNDYETLLAAELSNLGDNPSPEQASINLYRKSLVEQYRDNLRKSTYTAEQLANAQKEAAIELARAQLLEDGDQEAFDAEKRGRTNEVLARKVKSQIIEAYRGQQNNILFTYLPPEGQSRRNMIRKYPQDLGNLRGEALEKGLYEKQMDELLESALTDQKNFEAFGKKLTEFGVPNSLKDPQNPEKNPLEVALDNAKTAPNAELAEQEMLLERAAAIPQQEIDQRAAEKLPLPKSDDELLYGWASNRSLEQLQNTIRQERDQEFPEIAAVGIDTMKQMYADADDIVSVAWKARPDNQDKKQPREYSEEDYKKSVINDPNLTQEQKMALRNEYNQYQKDLEEEQRHNLHPRLLTDKNLADKQKMLDEAQRRQNMTEKQKRDADKKLWTERRDAQKKRRTFLKDYNARKRLFIQSELDQIDNAKNQKVKDGDSMNKAVNATASLFNTLKTVNFTQGNLGKAFNKLDTAFTVGNLDKGKALCNKLGVAPEVKVEKKAPPKAADFNDKLDEFKPFEPGAKKKAPAKAPVFRKAEKKIYIFMPEYKPPVEEEFEEEIQDLNYTLVDTDINPNLEDPKVIAEAQANAALSELPGTWQTIRTDRKLKKEGLQLSVSRLLATELLATKTKEEGLVGELTEEKIAAEAERIRNGAAFKKLFEKGAPNYLREQLPDKLIQDYKENVKLVNSYYVPQERRARYVNRIQPVVDALDATGVGKIYSKVRRPFGNSTAYENALASIRGTTNLTVNGDVSADTAYTSVQNVLKYLDKKESVRTRDFGKVRWNQCMTFLSQAMPPDKFKEYCDKVNAKRGVADNPQHENYVSPELFGSNNHKEALEETMDRINRGKLPEDYATLIALRNMDSTQPVDKRALLQRKLAIMNDPDFQTLAANEKNQHSLEQIANSNEKNYKQFVQQDDPQHNLINNNN